MSSPNTHHQEPAVEEPTPDLLTLHEVAAMLRMPDATLRYWRSLRIGPPSYKVGRHVRYQRGEVLSWLAAQRSAGGPDAA